jgi:hypothetical protein
MNASASATYTFTAADDFDPVDPRGRAREASGTQDLRNILGNSSIGTLRQLRRCSANNNHHITTFFRTISHVTPTRTGRLGMRFIKV